MFNFTSLFRRGAAEASASEMFAALNEAKAERQRLREEEQSLAGKRQDLLLDGGDAELDEIEARLNEVYRQCERLDLRIPVLDEAWQAKTAAERNEADRRAFDEATVQRLALAEQIDSKLAELGPLFEALENAAVILRPMRTRTGIDGPMGEFRLDGAAMRMVLLHHLHTLGRALGAEARGGQQPRSFHAVESAFMGILRGIRPAAPVRPEPIMPTPDELEAAERARALASRSSEYSIKMPSEIG